MRKSEQFKELINLYQEGKCSKEEFERLLAYLQDPKYYSEQLEEIYDRLPKSEEDKGLVAHKFSILKKIMKDERVQQSLREAQKAKRNIRFNTVWYKYSAVAAILIVVAYFVFLSPFKERGVGEVLKENERTAQIVPGGDKAFLILNDGTHISLDEISKDSLLAFDGISLVKNEDGSVSYIYDNKETLSQVSHHTIVTPKGGQYQVTLPDGSRVWLNAESTLRFPVQFDPEIREVEVKGEAYFEVEKQLVNEERVPFVVVSGSQKLEVLGTAFNIHAYEDENVVTTLVEGKVRLGSASVSQTVELKANEQAEFKFEKQQFGVKEVNTMYATAWKNGNFAFKKASIKEVMEDIARWYDVEVEYKSSVRDSRFTGTISRFEQIEKLLKLIELTESVHFTIEGRRIIVEE